MAVTAATTTTATATATATATTTATTGPPYLLEEDHPQPTTHNDSG
jgi:hypothetical protein